MTYDWPINNEILIDLGRKFEGGEDLLRMEQEWLLDAANKLSNALDEERAIADRADSKGS